uniref:Uncharacterized protein n=1 Tax=Siphoviridae sp. ctMBu2 TaxID=2827853 RepID=A0A8S5T543_9CAUD|nr:MAG TPA: hypothetical protein [Siphoviridae sp. ctMBu2]
MNAKKPPMRAAIETGSGWAAVPRKRRPDRGRILGKKMPPGNWAASICKEV